MDSRISTYSCTWALVYGTKMEEAKRFAATNAEKQTSCTVELNALFNIYQFHVQKIWNLIETSVSVGRDEREIKRQKRFSIRTSRAQTIWWHFHIQAGSPSCPLWARLVRSFRHSVYSKEHNFHVRCSGEWSKSRGNAEYFPPAWSTCFHGIKHTRREFIVFLSTGPWVHVFCWSIHIS